MVLKYFKLYIIIIITTIKLEIKERNLIFCRQLTIILFCLFIFIIFFFVFCVHASQIFCRRLFCTYIFRSKYGLKK